MEIYGPVKLKGSLVDGTGDELFTKDSSTDEVGTAANALGTLASANIFVGNISSVPTGVAVTGDIGITNAGVTSITADSIVNADVNSAAALNFSKMESLTASRALASDASGIVSVATTTLAELNFLSGTTSSVQTQISSKQATITGGASSVVSSNLTASRALVSGATGKIEVSAVTSTALSHISNLSSSAQDQLDTKLQPTITSVATGDILYYNGTAWVNLARGTDGQTLRSSSTSILWDTPTINGIPIGGTDGQALLKQSGTDFDADWETLAVASISDLTATAAELNILDGATIDVTELNFLENASSNIQSQLNNKQSTSLTTDNILKGVAGVATASTDLPTGITIGGAVIYRVGGTDVTLADGGTGASLADPGADRIMFWDDSAGAVTWLTAGSGLTITDTTITASGSISGLTANRVPYATSATALADDSALTWDATNNALTVGVARVFTNASTSKDLFIGEGSGNFTTSGLGANTGVGKNTLTSLTTGFANTALGAVSLDSIQDGSANVGAGGGSLSGVTSGDSNSALGIDAGDNITTGDKNVIIGYSIDAQSATSSGQLSIQNAIFGLLNTATGTTISTGTVGVYVVDPTASLDVAASTTAKASLRIRKGVAPTAPNDGDIWYDDSAETLHVRIDGVTKTFTLT